MQYKTKPSKQNKNKQKQNKKQTLFGSKKQQQFLILIK